MDNIKRWTGLPVEESIGMTEDRDKWCGQPSNRGRLKNTTARAQQFGEARTCSSGDVLANRHTDTLISILGFRIGGYEEIYKLFCVSRYGGGPLRSGMVGV